MTTTGTSRRGAAARARAWNHRRHDDVCDSLQPWAHGTVARASRFPDYWDYNLVRVEDDPGIDVEALVAFADEALAGLAHRRVDFDLVDVAERMRREFEGRGWETMRVVYMRHESTSSRGGDAAVEEVAYDAVHDLRLTWHQEDPHEGDDRALHAQAREVALRRGARVLVVKEGRAPVAYAQLEHRGAGAEITQVYVRPDHRGRGLGTAVTAAAVRAAGRVEDLWIAADEEDRAKDLYARLGFVPTWTVMELERPPRAEVAAGP